MVGLNGVVVMHYGNVRVHGYPLPGVGMVR